MDDLILDAAEKTNANNANAMRVKISAYQWRASKLQPRRYGDKLDLNIGGQPENPIALGITFAEPDPESENEEIGTTPEKKPDATPGS